MLAAEVDDYIKKHNLIKCRSKIIIGVSGGPDSMALLQYLLERRERDQWELIAVVVEHGLRGMESEKDVTFVRSFCEKNKIAFEVKRIEVNRFKQEQKMGTQEAARVLRYQAFDQLMRKHQANYLALAHHADDQVETVYMRLTRGTQLEALQGMKRSRPFSTGEIVRPFLSITKELIEQYCQDHGIIPRRDLSNEEDGYTRNYFRLNVLPLLKEKNPNLSETIMHMTENIADDSQYLSDQTEKIAQNLLEISENPKKVSFQINQLKNYPLALQRRLFHLILDYLYDHLPRGLTYKHEQQFFNLINSSRANASNHLPRRLKMVKSYQQMTFYFEEQTKKNDHLLLTIPGQLTLPNGAMLVTEIVNDIDDFKQDPWTYYLPINPDQPPSLVIRTRMPGDRIYLAHVNGRKKVKDLFIDKKIPLIKRDQWPLLERNKGEIIWVVGLAKSYFKKQRKEDHYLKITYQLNHKD